MIDNYNRQMNYLRIAITDRCNLRCTYCMPQENMTFLPKDDLLTFEEMFSLVSTFHRLGVNKLRLTGGEPFMRKGFVLFLQKLRHSFPKMKLHITSNGTLIQPFLSELKPLDLNGINISLDSINTEKFYSITKRNQLPLVLDTIQKLLQLNIPVKINAVIQAGVNEDDILPLVDYFKDTSVHLRFIEFMPFNEKENYTLEWTGSRIVSEVKSKYPSLFTVPSKRNSTSINYKLTETSLFEFGVINGASRTFCSTCNRIRLTSTGLLKTCLYANPSTDLKTLLRNGISEDELKTHIQKIVTHRFENGFEAQKSRENQLFESMSKIGG